MHLQVDVLDVQRQPQSLALNRARKRRRDVEIQRVAEFVLPRRAAGLDAGGHVARVVPPEARLAQ